MTFLKGKKGNLLPENTSEVLLAVLIIAIVIIPGVYFGYKFYSLYKNKNEEQAKAILRIIEFKINSLKEGENTKFTLQGLCGGGDKEGNCIKERWYLAGWDVGDEDRPERCTFQSCVCVCSLDKDIKELMRADGRKLIADSCQERRTGFCQNFNIKKLKIINNVEISNEELMRNPAIQYGAGIYQPSSGEANFILFRANLIEIEASKTRDEIIISLVGK